MPRVARQFEIFKALGSTGKRFSAFAYPEAFLGTLDVLGTAKLRRDDIATAVLSGSGTSLLSSVVANDQVWWIFGLGYRTDGALAPSMTLGMKDNLSAAVFPIDDTVPNAVQFEWHSPRLPFYLPEQFQISLFSSTNTSWRIQMCYIILNRGEYVYAPR